MLGLWAACKLEKTEENAADYAKKTILSGLYPTEGQDVLVRKIAADFQKARIAIGEKEVSQKMAEFLQEVTPSGL